MANRVATDLTDILVNLEAKLATDLSLATTAVFTTLSDDDEIAAVAPSTTFATITPHDFTIDQGLAAGAGRNCVGTDGQLKVCLWVQIGLDQKGHDASWLKNASFGALQLWKKLINSLHLYDPVNGSSDYMLEEPMRCLRWSNRPRTRKPSSWGKLESAWEMKFIQPLS